MKKGIKTLFTVSLFLNVLFCGIIIGHVSNKFLIKKQSFSNDLSLSEDKKKLFFNTMETIHKENRKLHEKMRAIRQNTLEILVASEFDEKSYQNEINKLHKLRIEIMQKLSYAIKELAKDFTQAERTALAEHLKRPPPPPPPDDFMRGRKPPKGMPPPRHLRP